MGGRAGREPVHSPKACVGQTQTLLANGAAGVYSDSLGKHVLQRGTGEANPRQGAGLGRGGALPALLVSILLGCTCSAALSAGPEFAAGTIVPCIIRGRWWGQGQEQQELAGLQSLAGDSRELELGTAAAGQDDAGKASWHHASPSLQVLPCRGCDSGSSLPTSPNPSRCGDHPGPGARARVLGKAPLPCPLPLQAGFLVVEHAKTFSLNFRCLNRLLITRWSPGLLGPKALERAENRPVTSFV